MAAVNNNIVDAGSCLDVENCSQNCRSGVSFVCLGSFILIILLLIFGLYINVIQKLNQLELQLDNLSVNVSQRDELESVVKRSAQKLLQSSDLDVVQMEGTLPALQIKSNGTIGPWSIQGKRSVSWATLSHDNTHLVIQEPGFYFLYAQIFYLTSSLPNSFEIVRKDDTSQVALSNCANQASQKGKVPLTSAEVSCFTAVVAQLDEQHTIYLNQIEQNRIIIFSSGFSHWGVIKINSK